MSGLGPLHFTGKVDRQEEMLILNQQKEQAVLKTLLENRDPHLYSKLYGTTPPREGRLVKTWCCRFTTGKLQTA